MSTNVCTFTGRLTSNPEITLLPNGKERVRFSIAVDRNYKRDDGTRPCDFIPVTIWGAAYVKKTNMGKGDKVCVSGRIELYEWTAQDGSRKQGFTLNCNNGIELVQKKMSEKDKAANQVAAAQEQGTLQMEGDDDLPF